MIDVVRRTAEQVSMPLTVGGGIRTIEDIRNLLRAGADKVSINSAAVRDPDFVTAAAGRFGGQCIVVDIDPKRVMKDGREVWEVHINGGRMPTGLEAVAWAREVQRLRGRRDRADQHGRRRHPERLRHRDDPGGGRGGERAGGRLRRGRSPSTSYQVLTAGGADAALAASIFHFGTYTIAETKRYLADRGVPVRL